MEKSETSEHNPIFGNKTVGCESVKPGSGRSTLIFPALPDSPIMRQCSCLERHNELPIGNKTNIVSIMLTKGWL